MAPPFATWKNLQVSGLLGERADLEGWLPSVDLVKVSRADLAWLYPGEPPEPVARRWLSYGPALVVVTRGPDGSSAFTAAGDRQVDGVTVNVVDTIGAGDAFMSGLLPRLYER